MKKFNRMNPKWVLAAHYLSMVYNEVAVRGFKPVNLNVAGAAEFMEQLGTGTETVYVQGGRRLDKSKKCANERLSWALLNIVWSHGRKPTADDRVDMERLAAKFLDNYRELLAELTLIGVETVESGT